MVMLAVQNLLIGVGVPLPGFLALFSRKVRLLAIPRPRPFGRGCLGELLAFGHLQKVKYQPCSTSVLSV